MVLWCKHIKYKSIMLHKMYINGHHILYGLLYYYTFDYLNTLNQ